MSDEIRKWLLKSPKPYSVRVETIDGDTQTVPKPPNNRFRDWSDTLADLDPLRLLALDAKGDTLRVLKCADIVESSSYDPDRLPAAIPMPDVLKGDVHAAMFAFYASHLANAYKGQEYSFGRLADLVDRSEARNDRYEERLERLEAERIDLTIKNSLANGQPLGEESSDGNDKIIQAFFSGAQARKNGASSPFAGGNGKGWGFSPDSEEVE